ncbi:MAG: TonB-dependent receptor, partial [Candidatus Eremiobacteraeota bacterium]|nr:TonB-dependent receptor [Candidatus Eremiobacteraeota bacterium]
MKSIARAVAVLGCAATFCMSASPGFAQSAGATVTATVLDVNSGLPVAGATVELYRGDQRVAGAVTRNDGTAVFSDEAPAIYHIEIRAQGYGPGRSDDVAVPPGSSTAAIRTVLQRSALSQSSLREIGRVSTAARGLSLQTSSAITGEISTERLQRQNYVRAGDALYVLPGVNLGSQDSAIGDDLQLNIRGIG